jgi:TrmH family RNA methyltransferase
MDKILTSRNNPLVKQIRHLHQVKGRREQQLFLLEGTHLVEEACQVGYPLQVVCCTKQWQESHTHLWAQLAHHADRLEFVSPEVLTALTTTLHPDGVVATAPYRFDRAPTWPLSLALVLETLQDPGNLGTIVRTAAATSVEGLWISQDSVDLAHPKVLRASAGQWFRLPTAVSADLRTVVQTARAKGMQVIATTPTAKLTYWQADLTHPTVFLLGNEGAGLSQGLQDLADFQVQIPLAAGVESLNVAIAAALLLYETRRQRNAIA